MVMVRHAAKRPICIIRKVGSVNRKMGDEPIRKALKSFDATMWTYFGFRFPFPLKTRKANSPQQRAKSARETTWNMRPAIMRFFPRSACSWVSAMEAIAPPKAWRIREIKSQVQKTRVYVRGLKRLRSCP